jgi:Tfp pilus assembly protein PilF
LRARSDWPLERAIKYLEAVVEKDPSLSEAWATLAIARLNIIVTQDRPETGDPGFRNVDPPARLQAARREANAALAIDPGSIDAMLALAIIDYRERANTLAETERRFRSLLDMAPNHLNVNLRMGMVLMEVGRARESLRYWKKAHDLDPLSTLAGTLYAEALIHVGHVEEANALIDEGIYDGFERSYVRLTMFLLENDFQGARDLFTGLEDNVVVWRSGLTEAADADHDRPDTARMRRWTMRSFAQSCSSPLSGQGAMTLESWNCSRRPPNSITGCRRANGRISAPSRSFPMIARKQPNGRISAPSRSFPMIARKQQGGSAKGYK